MTRIILNLKEHCIETEARRLHQELVTEYMGIERENKQIGEKIELLRKFVETSDFKKMRSNDRKLAGGMNVKVVLSEDADGAILMECLEADDRVI